MAEEPREAGTELEKLVEHLQGRIFELEDHIRYQSLHDEVTGLPNRDLMLDLTEKMLGDARKGNRQVAVVWVDVDNFKAARRMLGFTASDELLKSVAERISRTVVGADLIATMGRDEFLILFSDVEDIRVAEATARDLLDSFEIPVRFGNQTYKVSVSIGVSVGSGWASGLLSDAELALNQAKDAGKSCYKTTRTQLLHLVRDGA